MNNKPIESCDDDNCLTCELVNEFGEMIKEGTNWQDALRYVLAVAFSKEEETLVAAVENAYEEGTHDGVMHGIEQSQKALDNLLTLMVNKIANDMSGASKIEEDDDVIIFKGEDGTDDDIQKIIKKNQ